MLSELTAVIAEIEDSAAAVSDPYGGLAETESGLEFAARSREVPVKLDEEYPARADHRTLRVEVLEAGARDAVELQIAAF
ncbi:hypothetical protein DPMN_149121 [Dreissena polymorpha]|uniref:Uncharacterized protein n=1 Tax=Dreissena polymorpha TaxID=45954 RepID=A0A9D4FC53_DREPO|nr:hypothetical protein DPMN_149121 [Dreissena polymorpha]